MAEKVLTQQPHLIISYDVRNDVLIASWKGEQTLATARDGCERMLFHLQENYRCTKVLNDNSEVINVWDDAAEWVATSWFPRMHQAGCRLFAWVDSPDALSQLSKDKTLHYGIRQIIVSSFQKKEHAQIWLKAMR